MTRRDWEALRAAMRLHMADAAHDREHVFRVVHTAASIASREADPEGSPLDRDVLLAACLLHDIGREAQFADPAADHAEIGAAMAYNILLEAGWPENKAAHARDCIRTHRFRRSAPPATWEAKVLFDADKLDVTGSIGVARTLLYQGRSGEPLYAADGEGRPDWDAPDPSFFRECAFKLDRVYDFFYTETARCWAAERREAFAAFRDCLRREIEQSLEGESLSGWLD